MSDQIPPEGTYTPPGWKLVPVKAPRFTRIESFLKKALAGFLTAITSSAAVKAEKNIVVTVVTGTLVAIGATDGLVHLATSIINSL